MKKLILLIPIVLLSACSTTRNTDNSYTYIHNYNTSSNDPLYRKNRGTEEPLATISDEAPFYDQGIVNRPYKSAVIPQHPQYPVVNNHYYQPPEGTTGIGHAPMVKKFIAYGENR